MTAVAVAPQAAEEAAKTRLVKGIHAIKRGAGHYEENVTFESQLYRPGVTLDIVRARLYTESFKQTDGQPYPIRVAKANAHYWAKMPLYVQPGSPFIMEATTHREDVPLQIEKYWRWVKRAVHGGGMQNMLTAEELKELDDLFDYWAGRTEWDRESWAIPKSLHAYREFDGTFQWAQYDSFPRPTQDKIMEGLSGRIAAAERKLEELERTLPNDYYHQRVNVEAMLIGLKGARVLCERYVDSLKELAASERDASTKALLLKMVEVNSRVPFEAPRDFWEALQHWRTIFCLQGQEVGGTGGSGIPLDRTDVVFGPFWERSKAAGMTYEEGLELMKWWILRQGENSALESPLVAQAYAGQQWGEMHCIGGMDEDGNDVTNDVTYMVMDAMQALKINEPQLTLRVHEATPKKIILKALDMLKAGLTFPSFFNDTAIVPLMERWGFPTALARKYFINFCVVPRCANIHFCRNWVGWINLARVFSWAMNAGKDPQTGELKGAATKDPCEWTGYQDMLQAYAEQLKFFGEKQVAIDNVATQVSMEYMRQPVADAFAADSLERGLSGGEWLPGYKGVSHTWPVVAPVNVANAMAAIRKLIFEDRKVKMADLVDALHKNWEGYEDLRQLVLSAPKYGNDDDYADVVVRDVQLKTTEVMETIKDIFGIEHTPNGSNAATVFGFSWDTGPTADGRRKGEMLADGTCSPQMHTDKKGVLAVLRSASKIPVKDTYVHLLNVKLAPSLVEGEVGAEAFYSLIQAWMELGISHIQFNIISRETLLDAQAHPEKYQDLMVRVAGYSAYFIDLSKGMQDSIIERTEQADLSSIRAC